MTTNPTDQMNEAEERKSRIQKPAWSKLPCPDCGHKLSWQRESGKSCFPLLPVSRDELRWNYTWWTRCLKCGFEAKATVKRERVYPDTMRARIGGG